MRRVGPTGVQTHFNEFEKYLASCGTPCTVVTPFSLGTYFLFPIFGFRYLLKPLSVSANVAWYRYWHYIFLRRALRSHLAQAGETVVYAQCPLAARAALEARKSPNQRVVIVVHFRTSQADEWVSMEGIKQEGKVFRAIRQAEQKVLPQLDGAVFVSKWAREDLLNWLPELENVPSATIPNFMQSVPASPPAEPMTDLVSVGGLWPIKNHQYLLEILAAAKLRGRRYTLDVIGSGPCRRDLIRRARALGVDDQVHFLGYRTDVQSLLPTYRLYVHASRGESFCIAIIEALGAGLPVVAAPVGPIPELFDPTLEGRFWALDQPEEASDILISFLEDDEAFARAQIAARARFDDQFDAAVAGRALYKFLASTTS